MWTKCSRAALLSAVGDGVTFCTISPEDAHREGVYRNCKLLIVHLVAVAQIINRRDLQQSPVKLKGAQASALGNVLRRFGFPARGNKYYGPTSSSN